MPSAALRPKNPCQASLIEGWSVGVPGRTHPPTPASGCGTLLTLPASGGGPLLTPPPLAGEGGGNKRTGRPHSTPSQLVTCIISGALVEGGPNAIAAFRRILENSASQILPMPGWWPRSEEHKSDLHSHFDRAGALLLDNRNCTTGSAA